MAVFCTASDEASSFAVSFRIQNAADCAGILIAKNYCTDFFFCVHPFFGGSSVFDRSFPWNMHLCLISLKNQRGRHHNSFFRYGIPMQAKPCPFPGCSIPDLQGDFLIVEIPVHSFIEGYGLCKLLRPSVLCFSCTVASGCCNCGIDCCPAKIQRNFCPWKGIWYRLFISSYDRHLFQCTKCFHCSRSTVDKRIQIQFIIKA